jgi:hypothetical protein
MSKLVSSISRASACDLCYNADCWAIKTNTGECFGFISRAVTQKVPIIVDSNLTDHRYG